MERTRKMRQFYIEFIELYRSKPELWKVKSEAYKNRVLKAKAYDMLADKFKEIGEDVDKDFVKKKINSLRSSYRRELRKCKASLQSGEEEYIPSLWHFKYLYFLRDQLESLDDEEEYQQQHHPSRELRTSFRADNNCIDDKIRPQLKTKCKRESSLRTSMFSGDESNQQEFTPKKRRRDESIDQNELLQLAFQQLKQSNDEAEIMGRVWACEFKKLSPDQKIFAKKAIDDILFEGRMDTLHRHSVKINEGSIEYCSNLSEENDTKLIEFEIGNEDTE